jgi:hypothetical protein
MSNTQTSPNTMTDAIRNSVLYQLMNIHTAFPGSIVDYDYTTQKASIQPVIDKKYTDGTTQPMPILNNVPVIFPSSGGAGITMPVKPGDTCLVVCCERSIDDWLATGTQGPPFDPRKLDLSDGVAIMGLYPFTETSTADNNTDLLVSYSGSSIRIKENGDILIKTSSKVAIGTATTEVLDVISQLMTLLQGGLVMGAAFNGPLNVAFTSQVSTLQTQLNTIKGTIT